ncbi:MAG: hypothetical protein LAP21_15395 [Acidobacteriia bacterium]|nr:hypothetical protein [Terriglobia bacterium]
MRHPAASPVQGNLSSSSRQEIALGLDSADVWIRPWPLRYGLAALAIAIAATLRHTLSGFFGHGLTYMAVGPRKLMKILGEACFFDPERY